MKCIGWLNQTSVAVGTESEVRTKAIDIFKSQRWQDTHVGKPTTLRITTYGSQRLISEEPLSTKGYRVEVSASQVAYFNSTWPCSPIPEETITFEYAANGDLVDIDSETPNETFDGDALLALSQDAQKGYGRIIR